MANLRSTPRLKSPHIAGPDRAPSSFLAPPPEVPHNAAAASKHALSGRAPRVPRDGTRRRQGRPHHFHRARSLEPDPVRVWTGFLDEGPAPRDARRRRAEGAALPARLALRERA